MQVVLIALTTSLLLLSGCGQKGPLYLPQDNSLEQDNSLDSPTSRPTTKTSAENSVELPPKQ